MLFRLKRHLATTRFNLEIRGVTSTPSVACDPDSRLVLVTQLCHRDVSMYLLAIKSLARFIRPKRVFVVDDMSLTDHDKSQLRRHVPSITIVPITSVENTVCPKGGCWERLLFISDLASSD